MVGSSEELTFIGTALRRRDTASGVVPAGVPVSTAARSAHPEVGGDPAAARDQEPISSSIWLIADDAPSITPMSSTVWSASAEAKVLT